MLRSVRSLFHDRKGIAALEYALIAGLIFAAIIGATSALSPELTQAFTNLGISLDKYDAGT